MTPTPTATAASADQRGPFLAWQWAHYPENHRDARNLWVHVVTVPVFIAGLGAVVSSPFAGWWLAPAGLGAMALAMALQGRTHRLEAVPPIPFEGPGDVVRRIFAEQLVTFPRFVLSGGLARAWRAARAPRPD
ncbi:MAG: terminase [Myxococcota bacterium]